MRYKDSVDILEVVKKRTDFTEENFQNLVNWSYSEIIEYINRTFGDEREINEMTSSHIGEKDGKHFTNYSGIFTLLHPDGIVISGNFEYTDTYPPGSENYNFKKAIFNLFSDTTEVDSFKNDLEKIILEWKPVHSECSCCRKLDPEKLFNSLNNMGIIFE